MTRYQIAQEFAQPSRFDALRFAGELKTNFYTNITIQAL